MSSAIAAKILVTGEKGGCLKSTIVRALVVALAKKGEDVCVRDYDSNQLTVAEW